MTNAEIEKMMQEHPEKFICMSGQCNNDLMSLLFTDVPSGFWSMFEPINKNENPS